MKYFRFLLLIFKIFNKTVVSRILFLVVIFRWGFIQTCLFFCF